MRAAPFFTGMSLAQVSYREVEAEEGKVVGHHRGITPTTATFGAPSTHGAPAGPCAYATVFALSGGLGCRGPPSSLRCGCTS